VGRVIANTSKEFHIQDIVVLLTIAIPITFHGIGQLLVAPFSQRFGRRPVFILALLSFLIANLGLIVIKNITGFIILRVLQAATSAPLPILGKISQSTLR